MIHFLTRRIAALFAGVIERGSLKSAVIGAFLLGAAFLATALVLKDTALFDRLWPASLVIATIAGAFLGAFVGSRFVTEEKIEPWNAGKPVRIYNLNQALVPAFVATLFLGLAVTVALQSHIRKPGLGDDTAETEAVVSCIGLAATIIFFQYVLWTDVGSEIVVQKCLRRRKYPPTEVLDWGFELERGRLSKQTPGGRAPFIVVLSSGRRLSLDVRGKNAQRIVNAANKWPPTK